MTLTPPREAPPGASMARAGLPRTDLGPLALLVKILRRVVLDCTLSKYSARTGVHEDLISRYENGKVQRATRNLDRLLSGAGVLDVKEPLLLVTESLSALLGPPADPEPPGGVPLLGDLLERASQGRLLTGSRLSTGEYSHPIRRNPDATALLVRFLRTVLLGCSVGELSARTGIHRDVLSRYEAGRVQEPSPANLDRLLAEAQVLHLKDSLLPAMSDLAAILAHQPEAASRSTLPSLTRLQTSTLLAFAEELVHRTWRRLGLEGEKFPLEGPGESGDFREE